MSFTNNAPMCWKDFKKLSKRTQGEYIDFLHNTYNANIAMIAEMFQVSRNTMDRMLKTIEFSSVFPIGGRISFADKETWDRFIHPENAAAVKKVAPELPVDEGEGKNDADTADTSVVEADNLACMDTDVINKKSAKPMTMRSFDLDFDGKLNVSEIANSLVLLLGNDSVGRIHIGCCLGANNLSNTAIQF